MTNPVLPMNNHNTTAPLPTTDMGPPVLPAPLVSLMRHLLHGPHPLPVLDGHSFLRGPHPQGNASSTHVRPPVDYMSAAFVLPTKGAAHLPQPPMEEPRSSYHPVIGTQGYSNAPSPYNYALPDYHTTYVGLPTDLHPSHSLPELSMAVDHPSLINNSRYYSRIPTPHNNLRIITPPHVNLRHSTPNPSPQAHTAALVTPPCQISGLPYCSACTPLRTATEHNTSSVQYLGDIPANQLLHQHVSFPTMGPTKRR